MKTRTGDQCIPIYSLHAKLLAILPASLWRMSAAQELSKFDMFAMMQLIGSTAKGWDKTCVDRDWDSRRSKPASALSISFADGQSLTLIAQRWGPLINQATKSWHEGAGAGKNGGLSGVGQVWGLREYCTDKMVLRRASTWAGRTYAT